MMFVMYRAAEIEKEKLSVELEKVWEELCNVIRALYHLDSDNIDTDVIDSDMLTHHVDRLVSLSAPF